LLKLVENRKGLANVRLVITQIYMGQGKRDNAIQQLKMIDEECEGHNESLKLYASMLAEDGKKSEAIKILQKIAKFEPDKKTFANTFLNRKEFQSLSTEDEFKKLTKQEQSSTPR